MEHIKDILDKHYFQAPQQALLRAFHELELTSILNNALGEFKNSKNPCYSTISVIILTSINEQLRKVQDSSKKGLYEILLSGLFSRIILDLIKERKDFQSKIKETMYSIETCCRIYGYDFLTLTSQLDFQKILTAIEYGQSPKFIEREKNNQVIHLEWIAKPALLQTLTHDLHKSKYIKSRQDFEKLFHNDPSDFQVLWNGDKKPHLAYLFLKLNNPPYRMFKAVGGRGYWKFIESKIVDYSNQPFKKNYLNKTASNIRKNVGEFSMIAKEMDKILNSSTGL